MRRDSTSPGGRRPLFLAAMLGLALLAAGCIQLVDIRSFAGYTVIRFDASPDLEFEVREAMLSARPGTLLELPAGYFEFDDEISTQTSHVTLLGQGMDETILNFHNQDNGSQSIRGTGDEFVVGNLSIVNPRGDGIRTQGTTGAIFDAIRVIWIGDDGDVQSPADLDRLLQRVRANDAEPLETNGSYGVYPVLCDNVVTQNSVVAGASDAGIYVGQSTNITVRNNFVSENVAGIEIENSIGASVYMNTVTQNTGGILVFDLPGLSQYGDTVSVFANIIYDNNLGNFAPAGNIVAITPPGSGIIVMANDNVEIRNNLIENNVTFGVGVTSYLITQNRIRDPNFDAWPESIHIHDNTFVGGGDSPGGDPNENSEGAALGRVLGAFFAIGGVPVVPNVAWDGALPTIQVDDGMGGVTLEHDPARVQNGQLIPGRRLCVDDSGTFGSLGLVFDPALNFTFDISTDRTPFDCSYPPVPIVQVADAPPIPADTGRPTDERVMELCEPPGGVQGINWAALAEVECPKLSSYGLFPGGPATGEPVPGAIFYDLNTILFSDHAEKHRYVFLPEDAGGATIPASYRDTTPLDFPVGTVIAKSFSFVDEVAGTRRVVETRLLVHRPSGWTGFAYIWNAAETEAFLSIGGGSEWVTFTNPDTGLQQQTQYRVPNIINCQTCHGGSNHPEGTIPIGPKAALLNRSVDYGGGDVENQLARWSGLGLLTGAPADPADAPFTPPFDDPAAGSLDDRVRGYLDINCAHCHNQAGAARGSRLFLDLATDPFAGPGGLNTSYGFCKTPVAAGRGSGDRLFDIVPGSPADSILSFRLASAEPEIRMPELAKSTVHDLGVQIVNEWISGLQGSCDP